MEAAEQLADVENGIPDLDSCPFCGSLGVAIVGFAARCGSCGAVGTFGPTDAEAANRWNARARLKGPRSHPSRRQMKRTGKVESRIHSAPGATGRDFVLFP